MTSTVSNRSTANRRFIAVLLLVMAAGAALAAIAIAAPDSNMRQRETEQENSVVFEVGDAVALSVPVDAIPDEDDAIEAMGRYGVPWTGTISLAVNQVKYFSCGFDSGLEKFTSDYNPSDPIYVLQVTVKNESAESHLTTRSGNRWFNITSIFNRNSIVYFDGMPAEGNKETDYFFFDLPQGESANFVVGVALSDSDGRLNWLEIGAQSRWAIRVSDME